MTTNDTIMDMIVGICIGMIIMGVIVIAFVGFDFDVGYHSETIAFRNGDKWCDYYIQYDTAKVVNVELLGCIE